MCMWFVCSLAKAPKNRITHVRTRYCTALVAVWHAYILLRTRLGLDCYRGFEIDLGPLRVFMTLVVLSIFVRRA